MGALIEGLRWYLIGFCAIGLSFFSVSQGFTDPGVQTLDLKIAISHVVKTNLAAIVHVEALRGENAFLPVGPFDHEPLLQYAYMFPKNGFGGSNPQGTGVILDQRGNILTTHHVVGGAKEIVVIRDSGERYSATLIGSDPKTDLAVIRVFSQDPLPHISFGDSDKLDMGEWVIALGHPRDRDPIVSSGIIRARHRRGITDPGTFKDFLQTDAAVNNGYSGGPLLNLRGEVIGINSALVSESPDFDGIAFAIPGNIALHVVEKLITYGQVKRGWLGIRIKDLPFRSGLAAGLQRGALVCDVLQGGPGDKAGLKKGDVIIAFQNRPVDDVGLLREAVASASEGEEVSLTILREEKEEVAVARIGSAEDLNRVPTAPIKNHLGADMRPVTIEEANKFKIQPHQGVMITWVDPQGPFGQVGFEAGDIILEVNGRAFKNSESFSPFIGSLDPGRRITIFALDHRSGHKGYVQIKVK
ncbi:MAG: trypsin-like peptidase domain-containing protein [Deltaproteobacteria bacterium]|nr:trypsin-like peptidase domain-containing protein [Deltaproteobacteria bacterium]